METTYMYVLQETLTSFFMQGLLYAGIFNMLVMGVICIIKREFSYALLKKMRTLIFYTWALIAAPFVVALVNYLSR